MDLWMYKRYLAPSYHFSMAVDSIPESAIKKCKPLHSGNQKLAEFNKMFHHISSPLSKRDGYSITDRALDQGQTLLSRPLKILCSRKYFQSLTVKNIPRARESHHSLESYSRRPNPQSLPSQTKLSVVSAEEILELCSLKSTTTS